MGKKSRKIKKRRPFMAQAKFLAAEEALGPKKEILCIQCKRPGVWVHKEEFSGKKLMRTSPFIVVDTPHGTRSIHDYCLYNIQIGKESPAPAYVPKPLKPQEPEKCCGKKVLVVENPNAPLGLLKRIFSRRKVA